MSQTSRTYSFFLIYIFLNYVSGFIVTAAMGQNGNQMLFSILWQLVFFIPVIYIGVKMSGQKPKEVLSVWKVSPADILLAGTLIIGLMPILSLLSAIMSLFFPNASADTLGTASQYPLWMSIISLCIIPAVCEELIFRGIVFSGLKNMELKKACAVGGIIFAVAHFSLQAFLYTFFIGYIFCYIVYRTRSVIPCMVTHFTLNFTQVMMYKMSAAVEEAVSQQMQGITMSDIIFEYVSLSLFAIPIIAGIIFLMGKKYGRPRKLLKNKNIILIENESVLDYKPQKLYAEKAVNFRFIVIIVIYFVIVLSQYFV